MLNKSNLLRAAYGQVTNAVDSIAMANIKHDLVMNAVASLRLATRELDDAIEEYDANNVNEDNSSPTNTDETGPKSRVRCHVAIIVGHTAKAPGAYSAGLRVSEYPFWKSIAFDEQLGQILTRQLASVSYHTRDVKGIAGAYREADAAIKASGYPGFTIELHFNGSVNKTVDYSTTLHYSGSTRGEYLAERFEINLGQPNSKGPRAVSRNDRGGFNLSLSAYPSILIEPFFGSYENISAAGYDLPSWGQHVMQTIVSTADNYVNHKA